jgi:uncharacterized protein YukE
MTTFLGCDPVQLGDVAQLLEQQADDVGTQIALLDRAADVTWEGADADQFREELGTLRTDSQGLTAALENSAQRLREEADQQDQVSHAYPVGLRRAPGNPLGTARHLWALPHMFSGPDLGQAIPQWRKHLPHVSAPSSAGEPWISPEGLQNASHLRHLAVGKVPGLRWVQEAVDAHTTIGQCIDMLEEGAEYFGVAEPLAPAFDVAHGAHDLAGHAIGEEDSIAGKVLGDLDIEIANLARTHTAVGDAVADRDPAGVAASLETGLIYHTAAGADMTAEVFTFHGRTLAPAHWIGSGATRLADAGEGHLPTPAIDYLRTTGENAEASASGTEDLVDLVTDPEALLEFRRERVRMPWDQ